MEYSHLELILQHHFTNALVDECNQILTAMFQYKIQPSQKSRGCSLLILLISEETFDEHFMEKDETCQTTDKDRNRANLIATEIMQKERKWKEHRYSKEKVRE